MRLLVPVLCVFSILLLHPSPSTAETTGTVDPNLRWAEAFGPSGCDGVLFAVAAGDAGEIYVGGLFTECGGVAANNVARYEPTTGSWSALGSDGGNGVDARVRALAVMNGELYVGGEMTTANVGAPIAAQHIARWDGTSWSALGSGAGNGVDNTVLVLKAAAGALYVGGNFELANVGDPVTVNHIARWDGSSWSALGSGGGAGLSNNVFALEEMGDDLFVGGVFLEANVGDPVTARFLARWDGTSWSAVSGVTGLNGSVNALVASGDQLYFGGSFTSVEPGQSSALFVARWNSTDGVTRLGTEGGVGVSSSVVGLALLADDLYVAGSFTQANFGAGPGSIPASRIARWDGVEWSAVGTGGGEGLDNAPNEVVASGGRIYTIGTFQRVNVGGPEVAARALAVWDGTDWSVAGGNGFALRTLLSTASRVSAVAVDGDFLYFGGTFSSAGGVPANNIVRYQRSTGSWTALGSGAGNGTDNTVRALLMVGSDLYVGGDFSQVNVGDPLSAGRIARWDGSSWHTVGSGAGQGLSHPVYALAECDDGIYVGGAFVEADSGDPILANRIARWDGTTWHPLGSGSGNGVSAAVFALACDGTDLYAGGAFVHANVGDAVQVNRVARWDGSAWHALGSGGGRGVNSFVYALAVTGGGIVDGGELVVGGAFTTVNLGASVSADRIARWNGDAWSTFQGGPGGDLNGTVQALAVEGGDLYAAGSFTSAGGVDASRVAHWTGSGWTSLGSGVDGTVHALALPSSDRLVVGGEMTRAGGRPSSRVGFYEPRGRLSVTVDGGMGTVTSSPPGIVCPGVCEADFHFDTPITLTATPDPGYAFVGWSGACAGADAGAGPCELGLDQDAALGAEFEVIPEADLSLSLTDLEDPLPAGVSIFYTVEVLNQATSFEAPGVVVTADLPPGLSLVATQGCLEDPAGLPTCTLGNLAAGASSSFTLEAAVAGSAGDGVVFEACVDSGLPDPNALDNCAEEATGLDLVPPEILSIETVAGASSSVVESCETVREPVRSLRVRFSEALVSSGVDDPESVTHPANYRWAQPAEGEDFSTVDCASGPGTDTTTEIVAVTWDADARTATLVPEAGEIPRDGLHRLVVCGRLEDEIGNPLGGTGLDQRLTFRLDEANLLADGHFDRFDPLACTLDAWTSSEIGLVEIAEPDAESSPLSGSVGSTTAGGFDLAQCVPLQENGLYLLGASVRADGGAADVQLFCELFATEDCDGPALGSIEPIAAVDDTEPAFDRLEVEIETPVGTASALCGVVTDPSDALEVFVDRLTLVVQPTFRDGFENGDLLGWTVAVP